MDGCGLNGWRGSLGKAKQAARNREHLRARNERDWSKSPDAHLRSTPGQVPGTLDLVRVLVLVLAVVGERDRERGRVRSGSQSGSVEAQQRRKSQRQLSCRAACFSCTIRQWGVRRYIRLV